MTKPQLSAKELGLISLFGCQAREHVAATNKEEYEKYSTLYRDIIANVFTSANEILKTNEKELVTFTAIKSLTPNQRNFHFLLHTNKIRSRIAITIHQQFVPISDTTAFKKDVPISSRWITSVCLSNVSASNVRVSNVSLSNVSLSGEVAIDGGNVWYAANDWWLRDGESHSYYGLADCDTIIRLITKVVGDKNFINMILEPGE